MWSLPQSINILVVALIQNVDSIFGWTVDSRILPSCVQEICLCRKNPELRKVIQPLPLVGTGSTAPQKGTNRVNPNSFRLLAVQSPLRAVWHCRTQLMPRAPALLSRWWQSGWLIPDSYEHSVNRKVKSYGSGWFRFLNTLRPHTGQIQTSSQGKIGPCPISEVPVPGASLCTPLWFLPWLSILPGRTQRASFSPSHLQN